MTASMWIDIALGEPKINYVDCLFIRRKTDSTVTQLDVSVQYTTTVHEFQPTNLTLVDKMKRFMNETYHLHRDATHTAQIHSWLSASFVQRLKTGAKKINSEIVPTVMHARGPESGQSFSALKRRIETSFVAIRWALVIDMLNL